MSGADIVGVVEAAYRGEHADEEWVAGLLTALRPTLDHGRGVGGFLYNWGDPLATTATAIVDWGLPDGWLGAGAAMAADPVFGPRMRARAIGSASAAMGRRAYSRLEVVKNTWAPTVGADLLAVVAEDGTGRLCVTFAPLPRIQSFTRPFLQRLARASAHMAAGLRLKLASDATDVAVVSPAGKVLHATGDARERNFLRALRDRAVAIDRARSRLRRRAPDEALDLWKGLVEGRWSLVERFERDGKRFYIAHENAPNALGSPALSDRERQVVALVVAGHSNKLAGYALGLTDSVVSAHLRSAMIKVGVRSRTELVQVAMALGGSARIGS